MAGGLARSARMAADTIVALPEEVGAWKQEITYQIGLLGTDDDEQESIFLHIQKCIYGQDKECKQVRGRQIREAECASRRVD